MSVCPDENSTTLARARRCLIGQLAGLVDFQSPDEILLSYSDGVRELADGCTWNTIAGQSTDDSEMALLLGHLSMLTGRVVYDPDAALQAYQFWLDSDPFDCGVTIATGLRERPGGTGSH